MAWTRRNRNWALMFGGSSIEVNPSERTLQGRQRSWAHCMPEMLIRAVEFVLHWSRKPKIPYRVSSMTVHQSSYRRRGNSQTTTRVVGEACHWRRMTSQSFPCPPEVKHDRPTRPRSTNVVGSSASGKHALLTLQPNPCSALLDFMHVLLLSPGNREVLVCLQIGQ